MNGERFLEFVGDGDPLNALTRRRAAKLEDAIREVVREEMSEMRVEVEFRPATECTLEARDGRAFCLTHGVHHEMPRLEPVPS